MKDVDDKLLTYFFPLLQKIFMQEKPLEAIFLQWVPIKITAENLPQVSVALLC